MSSYQQQIDAANEKIRDLERRLAEFDQLSPLLHAIVAEVQETRAGLQETRELLGDVRQSSRVKAEALSG